MPTVSLKRSAEIDFEWPRPDGTAGTIRIPAVTAGQFRQAIALEAELDPNETPLAAQERLSKQARVLVGPQHAWFIDELDGEMMIEVMQCLLAVHLGMDPAAIVELQRALKKKTLLELIYPRSSSSEGSTN